MSFRLALPVPVPGLLLALGLWFGATTGTAQAQEPQEPVADLESAVGLVEVRREGEWHQAADGDALLLDDEIRTDVGATARVRFRDHDSISGAEATVLDLGPETHLKVHEMALEDGTVKSRSGFMDLVRGVLHAITKGWGPGSMFSVRAGTTICGIRGSIASVAFDPQDEAATVTSLDGEIVHFEADDLDSARTRHHEARHHHRRGRHADFLTRMEVGHQSHRAQGLERVLRRVDPEKIRSVRDALHKHRHRGGHRNAADLVHSFGSVRPTGMGPRRPPTRRLADRVRDRLAPAGPRNPDRPRAVPRAVGPGNRVAPGTGPDRRLNPVATPGPRRTTPDLRRPEPNRPGNRTPVLPRIRDRRR